MARCDRTRTCDRSTPDETVRYHRPAAGTAVVLFLALLTLPLSGWSVAAPVAVEPSLRGVASGPATEETEDEATAEATHEKKGGHEVELRHVVGLFLGFTDEKGHDPQFTEGLEYAYRVAPLWSVGVIFEHAGGELRNSLLAVPFYWFPHAGWFFLAGPGIEFHNGRGADSHGEEDEDERFFLVKIGVGYEFELGRRFILAPTYNLDFVDGEQVSVYGLSFGIKF